MAQKINIWPTSLEKLVHLLSRQPVQYSLAGVSREDKRKDAAILRHDDEAGVVSSSESKLPRKSTLGSGPQIPVSLIDVPVVIGAIDDC